MLGPLAEALVGPRPSSHSREEVPRGNGVQSSRAKENKTSVSPRVGFWQRLVSFQFALLLHWHRGYCICSDSCKTEGLLPSLHS